MGDISNWKSPIIGPKKKLIEDVDRADVIAEAKKLEKKKNLGYLNRLLLDQGYRRGSKYQKAHHTIKAAEKSNG